MQDDWLDALRNVLIFASIFALLPSTILAEGDRLAHEVSFSAYRLRQYDFAGHQYGSRSARVSWNAVSIGNDVLRKSLLVNWKDLVGQDLSTELQAAIGAVVIVLPKNTSALTEVEKDSFYKLEQQLSALKTDQAVYFIHESDEITRILSYVSGYDKKDTSFTGQLYSSFFGNNFVLTSQSSAVPAVSKASQANVITTLSGSDSKAPTLVFLAHYDTATVAPGLAKSADSTGSSVAALLELYSVFRNFYTPSSRPRFNMRFVFTCAAQFNYQGARQYIDSLTERDNIRLVTCLDALGEGEKLYMQVSKIPKEDSIGDVLFKLLSKNLPSESDVEIVHKKINLGADSLSWEHEIFNVKKRPALTLTHFQSHLDLARNTVLDDQVSIDTLYTNTKAIAKSFTNLIFGLDQSLCDDAAKDGVECAITGGEVRKERLQHYIDAVTNRPRHPEASTDFANFLSFYKLEQQLSALKTDQAVYFTHETDEITRILSYVSGYVTKNTKSTVSVKQQPCPFFGNNFFLTSQSGAIPAVSNASQANVIVSLIGSDSKAPTLVFLAHYDTATVAPGLAKSADSAGSGVAALLELYSVFRNFYTSSSRPRYNLRFVFTSASQFNYLGAWQYIESLTENDNIHLVTCLDALGLGEKLYMQVSSVPMEYAVDDVLFKLLSKNMPSESDVEIVHKKIHLAADSLDWEQEMFNVREYQSVTLTHFRSHLDPARNTVLDDQVNIDTLYTNTKAIAKSFTTLIFGLDQNFCDDAAEDGVECITGGEVRKERLQHYIDAVTSRPRHPEASTDFANFLVRTLEQLKGEPKLQDVKLSDAAFYTVTEDTLIAHFTMPTGFELLLGGLIAGYLFVVYLFSVNMEEIAHGFAKL
uniref:BOS complex subunit NCLN n=1 Tax=Panagrellus redivivus TaxID=6233 RepID=A0A7E4UXY1_PANRE